jgi:8-oxo-dGTP diphosphatase
MHEDIVSVYGNRIRVRVCGMCWENNQVLLVNHAKVAPVDFWAPPGGGVEFGSSLEENLKREFVEETGLEIRQGAFLFGCEYINPPLHAVELFFAIHITGGKLKAGTDPELPIIQGARFWKPEEIAGIPDHNIHGIFRFARNEEEFRKLSGFYRI